MDGLIPTGNIPCNLMETMHYGKHCDYWLLISPPPPPPTPPLPTASPSPAPHRWRLHGCHIVGGTGLGYRWESWAIAICCAHGQQWKGGLQWGSLSAGDRAGGHMPLFFSLLSPSLLPHPAVGGHFNDEHVLNSFAYLATAFQEGEGGLN